MKTEKTTTTDAVLASRAIQALVGLLLILRNPIIVDQSINVQIQTGACKSWQLQDN